ncbi:MAG: phosphoribosyltransferase family protein [Armatimonadota bacterium]|nr:phosphoribosyltransferase family protein [Armatimonadota bacterium]
MIFEDRVDAGRQLAQRLRSFSDVDCIVLAIPRGGVVVGFEVASAIDAPLDIIAPRKIPAPGEPELAIGAVTAWGDGYILDEETVRYFRVSEDYIEGEMQAQIQEARRRLLAYRGSVEPPDLEGKTALIVDDGIATGYTMLAAVRSAKQLNAAKLVVAAPVASAEAAQRIRREVDELICLAVPMPFMAVGSWYREFTQVTDEQVTEILRRSKESRESQESRAFRDSEIPL